MPQAGGAEAPPPPPPPLAPVAGSADLPPQRHPVETRPTGRRLAILSLTALGVVYGDIGTSPLYAIKECFKPEYGLARNATNVYGVLSLIVWALILVVSVKYVAYILRADNKGEGGVLALLALVLQRQHRHADRRRRMVLIALGLFGGAFLYGDGIITPAISVISAVEGLDVVAPALRRFVVPVAFLIIATLFYFQRKGTARVGSFFGWAMLVWFLTIATLGVREIMHEPHTLLALNPLYAFRFFVDHPTSSFVVLGAVVLVITGGEALYADMGHFGRRPIRIVWLGIVLPALLLNYFGQGALLLRDPSAVANPFYLLAPPVFRIPLLVIATSAAVVASQALISGAFSLTQQAVQLGYTPRVTIVHTSAQEAGQIYIPEVNKALAFGTLLLVVTFGSSAALGATYGVAVTGAMAITTILFVYVTRQRWGWPKWKSALFLAFFLVIDLAFFAANLLKIPHGGWVPLAVAGGVYVLMSTWKKGRELLNRILKQGSLPMDLFLADVAKRKPHRVPGTAVFMTSASEGAPVVMLHHLKHNKVLHEQVILMSVQTLEVPEVPRDRRLSIHELGHGFYRVVARFGFMETPNIPQILAVCSERGLAMRPTETSFFLGRERLIVGGSFPMARWRKKLFVFLSRNARSATEYFGIPPNRVVELGAQIEF
ncbi:MAG TPA: potassium transporter Kup [Thermoanaerobaculia bacterium]|nr:potassium transporter Kup [Thermoanaerobaculia bacterium]